MSRGNYRKELFLSQNTGKALDRTTPKHGAPLPNNEHYLAF